MYKCNDCGHVFDRCHIEIGEISNGYREEFACCPACGEGDIEEGRECAICGEIITDAERDPDARDWVCRRCGGETIRTLWKMADDRFSPVQLRVIQDILSEVCR